MGRRQFSAPEPDYSSRETRLLTSRQEAAALLQERLVLGEKLLSQTVTNENDLNRFRTDIKVWSDYNAELLDRMFDTPKYAGEYSEFSGRGYVPGAGVHERVDGDRRDVQMYLGRIRSIVERIPLLDMRGGAVGQQPQQLPGSGAVSRKVFVVHGRNDAAKVTVARFLEKLDLTPVILHEQPNAGRTILEKFESASDVGFAIVLVTPDDVGAFAHTPTDLAPRARQNVILEMGYFIGKLGRQRVCCLYAPGVDLPSDILGLAYVQFESTGAWQIELARELNAADLKVDLNKILA